MLYLQLLQWLSRFRDDERGPAMVEYGLLVALIAVVVAIAAVLLGQSISTLFSSVGSYISSVATNTP